MLVVLAGIVAGCAAPGEEPSPPARWPEAAIAELGGRTGALLIFDPRSCALGEALLARLNSLATHAPLRVRGVLLAELPGDSARAALGRDLGIAFPLVEDPGGQWRAQVAAMGLSQPVLIIVKRGAVRSVLAGEAVERLDGDLPGLEMASAGPP